MKQRDRVRVLVIEDDEPKLAAIEKLIREELPDADVRSARSLTSAVSALTEEDVDLAVIDMSLPTYDFSTDKAGGGLPQKFGGEDVLRFIESERPETLTVVVTQYEEFSDSKGRGSRSLSDLRESLGRLMGPSFLGVIHYSGQQGEWRARLREIVGRLRERKA